MAEATKITLSHKELQLVTDTDWIFTKHIIIQKVLQVFGAIAPQLEEMTEKAKPHLPEAVFCSRPKISKGENYQLLPYVMLDYPRCFGREDTLAIRTFFWWGNFFSTTLHLSGKYQVALQQRLEECFEYLQQQGYAVCINDNPWQHHFEAANYLPVAEIGRSDFAAMLSRKPFIKLAKKIPLQLWETAPEFVINSFEEMIQLLKTA